MRPVWAHFKNRKLVDDNANAYLKAGMPEWPFGFDKGREGDRLRNSDLNALFGKIPTKKIGKNPYGSPYESFVLVDGTYKSIFPEWKWTFAGRWYIEGDTFCYQTPDVHMGRPVCNILYRDAGNSKKGNNRYIELSNWGTYKYSIEPLKSD